MDKQHIKSGAKDIKGSVKEAVGKATGSRRTEAEGTADRAEGKTRKAVGDVKGRSQALSLEHRECWRRRQAIVSAPPAYFEATRASCVCPRLVRGQPQAA
jgi:uncharacterized protein YjbJ (UPF0337 family)